jgi:glycosyltransferase involved in cell wall biosynthesis
MIKGVSACCIFKDEEDFLPRMLPSWLPFCDEVVLVDTGSVDGTRQNVEEVLGGLNISGMWPDSPHGGAMVTLPSGHRIRLHSSPWRHDFSYHFNEALGLGSGPWAIQVDADEEMVGDPAYLAWAMSGVEPLAITFCHQTPDGWLGDFQYVRAWRWRDQGWRYRFWDHPLIEGPPEIDRSMELDPQFFHVRHWRSSTRDASWERARDLHRRAEARGDLDDKATREHWARIKAEFGK